MSSCGGAQLERDGGTSETAIITVIVPTFRRPEMLSTCLAAIQNQTWTRFRVLVCDNSPDREGEAVVAQLEDARFVYRPRAHNLGILGNVLAGFQEADTPLVMEVDDDDILYPKALERLADPLLADPTLAVAFSELDAIGKEGEPLPADVRRHFLAPARALKEGVYAPIEELAVRGRVYMVSAVFRREFVNWASIPEGVATAYDRYVTMAAAEGGRGGYYVPDALVGYRIHGDGDAVRHEARQLAGALLALQLFANRVLPQTRAVLNEEILRTRVMLTRAHLHERNWLGAWATIRPALTPSALCVFLSLLFCHIRRVGSRGLIYSVQRTSRRSRMLD